MSGSTPIDAPWETVTLRKPATGSLRSACSRIVSGAIEALLSFLGLTPSWSTLELSRLGLEQGPPTLLMTLVPESLGGTLLEELLYTNDLK